MQVEVKGARAFAQSCVRTVAAHPAVLQPPRSGINVTAAPRRGFSANYIDARTRVLDPKPALAGPIGVAGHTFPLVWASPFDDVE